MTQSTKQSSLCGSEREKVFSGGDLSEYTGLLGETDTRLEASSLSYGTYSEVKTLEVGSVSYVTDVVAEYTLSDQSVRRRSDLA